MKARKATEKSLASFRALSLLCLVMLSAAVMKAQTPYAIWCEGNSTLYFTNSNETYAAGGTYEGKTITAVWSGGDVTSADEAQWTSAVAEGCTKVVFNESFKSVKPTSLNRWFYNFKNLTTIEGLTYLNTIEATTMRWMFSNCQSLGSLDLSHFDTRKVTNMNSMFSACQALTTLDIRSFDMSKVTTMQQMFQDCSNLTTIFANDDWSALSPEPTSDNLFYNCTSLKGGNGTEYNVGYKSISRARPDGGTDAPGYFTTKNAIYVVWCEGNKTLYFTYDGPQCVMSGTYNGEIVTKYWTEDNGGSLYYNIYEPFWSRHASDNADFIVDQCQSVVIESNFIDARPTRTAGWFANFKILTSITGFQYLNTSEVTDMTEMFASCEKLTFLDLSRLDTRKVTRMNRMFDGCSSLTDQYFNLNNLNTENVTQMIGMFRGCSRLTSLDLSHFDTGKVTKMSDMFVGCSSLKEIKLFSNVKNVTDMTEMFAGCSSLRSLDMSGWAVPNNLVVDGMFYGCSSLESVNLKNFELTGTQSFDYMFSGCAKLKTIYCDYNWNEGEAESSTDMFKDCISLVGANYTTFDEAHTGNDYARLDLTGTPGYFSKDRTPFALWNAETKTLLFTYPSLNDDTSSYSDLAITNKWFGEEMTGPENHPAGWVIEITTESGDTEFLSINSKCEHVVFDPSFVDVTQSSLSHWFDGMTNLKDIAGLQYLNTTEAQKMTSMFAGCSSLTELDLRQFDLFKTDNACKMFYGCTNLKTIYSDNDWSYLNVENTDQMFTGCTSLVGGNGTAYDETRTGIEYANIDRNAKKGYFSRSADPLYVIWCEDNGTIYFTYTDQLYNVGDSYDGHTISVAHNMTELPNDILHRYSSYVREICTTIVFDESMRNVKPTNLSSFFKDYENLTGIEGLQNLNTSEVTSMDSLFYRCMRLGNIDVSHFDTRKVTDMTAMFAGCEDLNSISGLRMLNTSNVTSMESMFANCSSLKELDVNNFDTGKVTVMKEMFKGCSKLLRISCDNDWRREGVEIESSDMFLDCSQLLVGYDAGKLDINYAHPYAEDDFGYFLAGNNIPDYSAIWCEDNATLYFVCEDQLYDKGDTYNGQTITNVWTAYEVYKDETGGVMDYPRWNSDQFAADRIAGKCQHVVFESSFSTALPETTQCWFAGFSLLTSVDGIENLNTGEVKNFAGMFKGCSSLTSLDLSSFTTIEEIQNIDMHEMFSGCRSLTSVDLSNFNSENVQYMSKMFSNCTLLKTVDLTNFSNTSTMDMAQVFYGCLSLTTIYCNYDWNKPNVMSAEYIFFGCDNLRGGNGTSFKGNDSGAGIEYARPDFGSKSEGYFTKVSSTPYVIWCESSKTLYFTNSTIDLAVGDNFGDVDGQTITALWSGDQVTNSGTRAPWYADDTSIPRKQSCDKVVIDESFQDVKPTSLNYWFAELIYVEEIQGLQYLNTSEATSMAAMFMRCGSQGMKALDVSHFDTGKVTDMQMMFAQCAKLTSIDLNSFDVSHVTTFESMFHGCSALTTIFCQNDWSATVPESANTKNMFYDCSNLKGGNGTSLSEEHLNIEYARPDVEGTPGYFTDKNEENTVYAIWCEGNKTFYFTKSKEQYIANSYYGEQIITNVWAGDAVMNHGWYESGSSVSGCTTIVIDESFSEVMPESFDYWFADLPSLTDIVGLEYLNTSAATNMERMFSGCSSLTSLDVSHFDVSKVTNMDEMFRGCSALKTIYCSNDWQAQGVNVTTSVDMFKECPVLVGEKGSAPQEGKLDIAYAHRDLGEENPGYFTHSLSYDLTISDAMVGTLYLDFPVVIPEEDYFDVYYVKSINESGTMYLKEVRDVIPANTAVIIFGNEGTYSLTSHNGDVPAITSNLLKGVLEATSVADLEQENGTDIYVLSRGQNSYIGFRKAGGAVKTIPANRAYLPYTASNNVQELSISFDDEDATGIADIAGHTDSGETKIYNLAGQRVKNPQRGIYIVNGKKVYIH